MIPAFAFLTLSFVGLSAIGHFLSGASALAPVSAAIVIWGLAAWAFFPAQQSRLMQVAGLKIAAIALSLNASFMYLGFLARRDARIAGSYARAVTTLGLVGAVCEIGAVLVVLPTVLQTGP